MPYRVDIIYHPIIYIYWHKKKEIDLLIYYRLVSFANNSKINKQQITTNQMKKSFYFLGLFLMSLVTFIACDDDDKNDNVTIKVTQTEFYTVGEKQTIKVPFTVTPTDFTVTADAIEMGALKVNTSGDRLHWAVKDVREGNTAGEWIADVEVAFNGTIGFTFSTENNFPSNIFTVLMKQENGEVYVTDPVTWKRSDADFDNKDESIDLSAIAEKAGGFGNQNQASFVNFLTGTSLEEDFCLEQFNKGRLTLTMVDSENANNGVYAVTVESKSDNKKFTIWVPVVITD